MRLPFIMSISGTIPLVICIVLWLVQREDFHVRLGLRLLRFSMFFYLVPIQLLYFLLLKPMYLVDRYWENGYTHFNKPVRFYYNDEIIITIDEISVWIPIWAAPVVTVWMICTFIFAFNQFIKYRKLIKNLHMQADSKQKENCIVTCENQKSPYSIGFLHTFIVMPKEGIAPEHRDVLYRHEFCHIKNKDSWMKLVCLVIICLHFYNPFSYLLLFMYNILCEYACDMYAVENLSKEERRSYAKLLVNLSAYDTPLPLSWKNGFSCSKYNIQRRIEHIMKKKSTSASKKILSFVLSIIAVFSCTATIWAYEPVRVTSWNPKETIPEEDSFIEYFIEGVESELFPAEPDIDFSKSDVVLITEDGTQIPVFQENAQLKKACSHTYRTKTLAEHKKKSTGGCVVNYYDVDYCTKCKHYKNKTLTNSISYKKCIHY